jgi:hypothetical protein
MPKIPLAKRSGKNDHILKLTIERTKGSSPVFDTEFIILQVFAD